MNRHGSSQNAPIGSRGCLMALVPLSQTLTAAEVDASPWTLPRGTLVITGAYAYQVATQEFLDAGGARNFPLRGRYVGNHYTLGVRLAPMDGLELELAVPLRTVSYASDPVLLLPRPTGSSEPELDYYQRNVINLTRSSSGLGDLTVAARWRVLQHPFPLALELRGKVPTGYDPPQGTFGARPQTREEFVADVRRWVVPDNVRDDVTLGDGQLDLGLNVLFGYAFRSRTFVRIDAGYNFRLGGAGDQVLTALRVGQGLGDRLLLYAWGQLAYTVTQGRVIGVSVAAVDPDLPAVDYNGVNNLLLRELRLERDQFDLGGGFIVRITRDIEINLGYMRTLWGRNTAATHTLSASLGVRTRFTAPP